MISEQLRRVREATRTRETATDEWLAALADAVQVHTFADVARVAGLSRQRVAQLTGPVGRRPGRGNLKGQS
jgi:hypothetical protein